MAKIKKTFHYFANSEYKFGLKSVNVILHKPLILPMRYVRKYCGIIAVLHVYIRKSLYNQYFITKGIMCIIDIMDENGILLKWEKAKQKYDLNISSYLSWLGLVKSIPTAWKFNLRDGLLGNPLRIDLQNESMAFISSKISYEKVIQPLSEPLTSQLYSKKC